MGFNEEQLIASQRREGTLLVSASAGSGKTSVLVGRVIKRITDKENPCDLDRLLIVTYTNAAAAEMRGRIVAAVTAELAKAPSDKRLRRQLTLLHKADIMTIHAFCKKLISNYFYLLGISPDFRIADESEADLIRMAALERIMESRYDGIEEDRQFKTLVDMFSGQRDDARLFSIALDIHKRLQSCPYPEKWLSGWKRLFECPEEADIASSPWCEYMMSVTFSLLRDHRRVLQHAMMEMKDYPEVNEKYGANFEAYAAQAGTVMDALADRMFDRAYTALQGLEAPPRLSSVRKFEDKDFLERMKSARNGLKNALETAAEKLLYKPISEIAGDFRAVAPAACGLLSLVADFSAEFAKEKRERQLLDFNDLEHFALSLLLSDKSGVLTKTPVADELARHYVEIMVDEYQDANEVQDIIFTAVSQNGGNLFMVGDLKQSIYRFRLADPEIFSLKYRSFEPHESALSGRPAKISLSKNYRSRKSVVDAVNFLFEKIMSPQLGGTDYGQAEKLCCGAVFEREECAEYAAECCVIDLRSDQEDATGGQEDGPGLFDNLKGVEIEARYVADRARRLLESGLLVAGQGYGCAGRPVTAGDIVILLRSVADKAHVYENALLEAGIPAAAGKKGDFFGTVEISVMLSLLKIIDNPMQDIPLISVLRSPAYRFTADALAGIRIGCKKGTFYEAVKHAAEDGNAGCARFLEDLYELRLSAPELSVFSLLWKIFNTTGLFGLFGAMYGGQERRNNLMTLCDYANKFENTGYRGLFDFIKYMERAEARGIPDAAAPSESADSVRIMSIHKSKGLEFPVVFVSDCAKSFNRDDLRAPVLFHADLGVGPYRRDIERMIEYPTVMRTAISERLRRENLSEEMRVLYVAATRAKEKLIITMTQPNAEKSLARWRQIAENKAFLPECLAAENSPAGWIGASFMSAGSPVIPKTVQRSQVELVKYRADEIPPEAPETDIGLERLRRLINFRYVYEKSQLLPSKVTPTQIKGRNIDFEVVEQTAVKARPAENRYRIPSFVGGEGALTPAMRGTAHHLVMQFMPFRRMSDVSDVTEEINALVSRKIITQQQADAVDADKIAGFFRSDLAKRLFRSAHVTRELKFSVMVAASEVFKALTGTPEGGDELLLQGVIDCMFEEEGELVIVDFKTDRVTAGNEAAAAENYRNQLDFYAMAVERIYSGKVREKSLFFLHTGNTVTF